MFKRRWMVGLAATAAVAALAVGALAVGAQSQEGDGTTFLDRVASKLGIDTPKLEQAIKDTRSDEIDQAVTDGKLTQEQADELKERLDDVPVDGFGPGFSHGFGRGVERGGGFGMEFRSGPGHFKMGLFGPGFSMVEAQQKVADFLGITPDELKTQLEADGATLASVAEANGKSRDDLTAFIRTEAETQLSQAVTGGKLTQERADGMLAMLDEHIDKLIDHGFFRGGPGGHFRRGDAPADGENIEEFEQRFDAPAPLRSS